MKCKATVRQKKSVRNTRINPLPTETIPGMLSPSLIFPIPDHSTDLCSLNGMAEFSLPYKFTERRTWHMHYCLSVCLSLLINDLQEIQHACYSEWSVFSFYFYFRKFNSMNEWRNEYVFILFQTELCFGLLWEAPLCTVFTFLLALTYMCLLKVHVCIIQNWFLYALCFSHENA